MFNMNQWYKISILLCIFGFLKEFRPSEPFIFEFLKGPWRDNLTSEQINQEVFPVNTYSYLAQLIIVFLITDLLRYKLLIIVLGISGIVIWSMLIWTKTILELQILEGVLGTYLATEVAYYTYVYAKIPKEYYQQVTGHVRAATLTGKFASGVVSQLLVSFKLMDYMQLNYISLSAQILATIWALFLPSVKNSIYFNQEENNTNSDNKTKRAFKLMWEHLKKSFSNMYVIQWSIWWAMTTCIFVQIINYMQPLWSEITKNDNSNLYNGAVEAISMCLGSIAALCAGTLKINWRIRRDLFLIIISLIMGVVLFLTSQTEYIFVSYACHIVFNILYLFGVTVATAEVCKVILEDTYGLVFGLNTFIASLLQTILTLIVVNGNIGFGMSPRRQYVVYSGFLFVVAFIYIVIGTINYYNRKTIEKNKDSISNKFVYCCVICK